MEANTNTTKPQNNKLLWTILIVFGVIVIGLVVFLISELNEKKEIVAELNEDKVALTFEFQNLALDYDSLRTNNDTLNLMLEQEREKISQLIDEMKTVKATNASKIREYRKELTSLRKVLKNYVVQIDSLNRRNIELTEENKEYQQKVSHMQTNYKELEVQKQKLAAKVDVASKLETKNLEGIGMTSKDKETRKASRVSKIRVCCTILKNITASVGEKTVYLRIVRPDKALLMRSLDDKFEFENDQINYSAKRMIEYGGEDVDVCVYYKVDAGELMEGLYTADLFSDGNHIGSFTFELK